jgi:hypothetical protein
MKKNIIFFLFFSALHLHAQRDLKPVTDATADFEKIISKTGAKIKKATVASETGVTMDLGLELEGFKRDKKYKIKGEVLNKTKLKLKEVEPVTVDVINNSTSAEMTLKFNTSANAAYTSNKVESYFIRLIITEVDPRLGDLLGDTGLNSSTYIFECKKDWRIKGNSGNSNVVVEVKLTPYKSAASIQQYSN